MRQRLHWLALHGFIRSVAWLGAKRGDPQGRLIADPAVKADPVPFYEGLRRHGPVVRGRISYLALDHAVAHEVLRSEDFRVLSMGSNLPAPLRRLESRVRDDMLHPLRPPSLLSVEPPEHTRYRKTVSSVFTPRAVAALRDRVEQTATALLDELAGERGVVDIVERYCSQLPVAVISDILGVPDSDRGTSCSSVSWRRPAWTSDCPGGNTSRCSAALRDSTSGWPATFASCGARPAMT